MIWNQYLFGIVLLLLLCVCILLFGLVLWILMVSLGIVSWQDLINSFSNGVKLDIQDIAMLCFYILYYMIGTTNIHVRSGNVKLMYTRAITVIAMLLFALYKQVEPLALLASNEQLILHGMIIIITLCTIYFCPTFVCKYQSNKQNAVEYDGN